MILSYLKNQVFIFIQRLNLGIYGAYVLWVVTNARTPPLKIRHGGWTDYLFRLLVVFDFLKITY